MEQKTYMTTGELAKLMGITKETLFHYDEIGLFRPAVVMPNGYRKYEIRQTELLNTQPGKNAESFFRTRAKNSGRTDKVKKYETMDY